MQKLTDVWKKESGEILIQFKQYTSESVSVVKLHWKTSSIKTLNLAPCINMSREKPTYRYSSLSESGIC